MTATQMDQACGKYVPFVRSHIASVPFASSRNCVHLSIHFSLLVLMLQGVHYQSILQETSNILLSLLKMNDIKENEVTKAPLTSLSRRRYACIPNTSEFWVDLFLAKSAYQSSSVSIAFPASAFLPF